MKQTLSVIGVLAIIALVLWLLYLCVAKLVDIGAEDARIASIAEYTPKEKAWSLKASKDAAAMEASIFIINRSVLSGKITTNTITVCAPIPAVQGEPEREPQMADYRGMCGDSQHVIVFPVTYDAFGKATIGTPTVTR